MQKHQTETKPRPVSSDSVKRITNGMDLLKRLLTQEKEYKKNRVRINKLSDAKEKTKQLIELGEKESKIKQYILKCEKGMSQWDTNVLFIGPFDDDHIKVNKREIEKYFEPSRLNPIIDKISVDKEHFIVFSTNDNEKYQQRGAIVTSNDILLLKSFVCFLSFF